MSPSKVRARSYQTPATLRPEGRGGRGGCSVGQSQNQSATVKSQHSMHIVIWMVSALFALAAGITALRLRRIPNWLTYPAAPIALGLHALAGGWAEVNLSA